MAQDRADDCFNLSESPLDGEYNPGRSHVKGRRGPKPKSQPAPNPKAQRNRDAQRQHRFRKEQYVRDLEQKVTQLKNDYVDLARKYEMVVADRDKISHERDKLAVDNYRLRESSDRSDAVSEFPTNLSLSSVASTQVDDSSDPETTVFESNSSSANAMLPLYPSDLGPLYPDIGTLDYDDISINFVLHLEQPCSKHVRFLVGRANYPSALFKQPDDVPNDGENTKISGHALMASCPALDDVPVSHEHSNQLPDISKATLAKMLGLADQLELSRDELPPVKAWAKLRRDYRFPRLNASDFRQLQDILLPSVRCLRFGAIITAADLESALEKICGGQRARL